MRELLLDLASDPAVAARLGGALAGADAPRVRLDDLRRAGPRGTLGLLRGGRYDRCVVLVNDFRAQGRWLSVIALALAARARRRVLVDPSGRERPLTFGSALLCEVPFAGWRALTTGVVLARALRAARALRPAGPRGPVTPRRALFVRSDLGPPLAAGGSLAHILGVLSGLEQHGVATSLLTPAPVLGAEDGGRGVRLLPADDRYRLSQELPPLAYNERLAKGTLAAIRDFGADLVYHRYGLGSCGAALAAQRAGVPLVVEFNGSEVWIARHWGHGLRFAGVFAAVERAVLRAADLVVAVSEPLREPLHAAGVPDERILVNPNGVDVERLDAAAPRRDAVRARLGIGADEIVFVFVGTFGPWHGAEVFAQAAATLDPAARRGLRLLFVGDGARRGATEEIVARGGLSDRATFTGLVPQSETPGLLAAADVCVSPHVPNPDGTPFFGSPTKLFEYLASARPVIASALDQIGEVLEHDRTAWLVPPGDAAALAAAMTRLAADPALRARLGAAGRARAVAEHSWTAHVGRILARLRAPR